MTRTLLLVSWLTACAAGSARQRETSSQAILYIASNVRDAQLYVDGRFIAALDALGGGVAVEPGTHRLELRHEDYFSTYREVEIARAARKNLAMDMAPILP
jgi:hypothetical protein